MQLTIQAYGPLIPVLGSEPFAIELNADASARDLLKALQDQYPALADWEGRIACAQQDALLPAAATLSADSVIELIPPVSGG